MGERLWWERQGLEYKNSLLFFEGKSVEEIAREYGTPLFVYSADRIRENYTRLQDAFSAHAKGSRFRIRYAIKALSPHEVLSVLRKDGCEYLDANSIKEARTALRAGFKPENIIYTETNIDSESLEEALALGLFINVDSLSQITRLHKINHANFDSYPLNISLRWNPGAGVGERNEMITAGREVHGVPIKFGIPENKIEEAYSLMEQYGFRLSGLHQHLGSNWHGMKDMESAIATVDSTLHIARGIQERFGSLQAIDFGGGPGVRYCKEHEEFPVEEYAKRLLEKAEDSNLELITEIEPGRYITADAGILVLGVGQVEEKNDDLYIGVNGMFPRPFYYKAYHEIVPVRRTGTFAEAIVAGPYCETEIDLLTASKKIVNGIEKVEYRRMLEIPEEESFITLLDAGAYGFEMLPLLYNSKKIPGRIMIDNGQVFKLKSPSLRN